MRGGKAGTAPAPRAEASESRGPAESGVGPSWRSLRARARDGGSWTYEHETKTPALVERVSYLVKICAGRRVLHVGCAAEFETAGQCEEGSLLFDRLERVAAAQLGIDPDSDGIERLRRLVRPRVSPIAACFEDVATETLASFLPDLILLPEVLEHLTEPAGMLRVARDISRMSGAEVVVTVPSGMSPRVIEAWVQGREHVHPDHVASYSPRTLQTLLEKCDLEPAEIRPYSYAAAPRRFSDRGLLMMSLRGRGTVRQRIHRAFVASVADSWPDGWIARAR